MVKVRARRVAETPGQAPLIDVASADGDFRYFCPGLPEEDVWAGPEHWGGIAEAAKGL